MKRKVDYDAKLARNAAATRRWISKLKLASGKLSKLTAQRARILKTQHDMAKAGAERAVLGAYGRKFV